MQKLVSDHRLLNSSVMFKLLIFTIVLPLNGFIDDCVSVCVMCFFAQ